MNRNIKLASSLLVLGIMTTKVLLASPRSPVPITIAVENNAPPSSTFFEWLWNWLFPKPNITPESNSCGGGGGGGGGGGDCTRAFGCVVQLSEIHSYNDRLGAEKLPSSYVMKPRDIFG